MAHNLQKYLNVALKLAKEAGQMVRDTHNSTKKFDLKSSDIDVVTETDQNVEKLLINGFAKEFPDHKFIGEESVAAGQACTLTDDPTWILDPIDGTMNFVHNFPHSCISIGLFIEKEPAVAVVYNPILEQLFTAQKGQGAFYNGKKISVSGQTDLSKSMIMFEIGTSLDADKLQTVYDNVKILATCVHGMRSLGSCALDIAMVALGAADAHFEFGPHLWDIAAAELILTEAGGVIIDPSGGPVDRFSRRFLCASTRELAEKLSQKLVQFYPQPRD